MRFFLCIVFGLSLFYSFRADIIKAKGSDINLSGEVDEHISYTNDKDLYKISTNLFGGVLVLNNDRRVLLDRFSSDRNIKANGTVIICASI